MTRGKGLEAAREQLHPSYLRAKALDKELEVSAQAAWRTKGHREALISGYKENAFTTWQMSYDQVERDNPRQKQLVGGFLSVCAFFSPYRISEDIFRRYFAETAGPFPWIIPFTKLKDSLRADDFATPGAAMNGTHVGRKRGLNRQLARLKLYKRFADSRTRRRDDVLMTTDTCTNAVPRTWCSDSFWRVISSLHQVSLLQSINKEAGGSWFSLHPLIHDWLQLRQRQSGREMLRQSINVITEILGVSTTWQSPLMMRMELLAHVDVCISNSNRLLQDQGLGSGAMGPQSLVFAKFL